MPPVFIFMRHGQAEHNVAFTNCGESAYFDPQYRDSKLTLAGGVQCYNRGQELASKVSQFDRVYVSSLDRCIQTALWVGKSVKLENFAVFDELIERGGHACNERGSASSIKQKYPQIDVSYIAETCAVWENLEPVSDVKLRMMNICRRIYQEAKANENVLIVSHHDALECLFNGLSLKNAETVIISQEELASLFA